MKLYFDGTDFHKDIKRAGRNPYETTSEYRAELFSYITNNTNREDVFRIVPDETGKPVVIEIPIDWARIFRKRRSRECFPIINRGSFWYNTLTEEQKTEVQTWYQEWLDAPTTLIEPIKPTWSKG